MPELWERNMNPNIPNDKQGWDDYTANVEGENDNES